MKKIKSFHNFIYESDWGGALLGAFREADPFGFAAKDSVGATKPEKVNTTTSPTTASTTVPTSNTGGVGFSVVNAVPGNDDFVLYMQHQQGLGGAKSLVAASLGSGQIHPDTLKVKNCSHLGGKVPYANLQCNIPSDRPQYKRDIVEALNKGDQKTGASLFLKMWKEKWMDKSKQAKVDIEKPQNATVKQAILKNCQEQGVPFDFAVTVAKIESGFNPKSGNARYKGLFALSQEEFRKYVPSGNIFNAEDNAKAGIMCLKNNIKQFTKYMGPLLAKVEVGGWAKSLA